MNLASSAFCQTHAHFIRRSNQADIASVHSHSPQTLLILGEVFKLPEGSLLVLQEILLRLYVAVSCGYDTCFAVLACDGLCHLTKTMHHIGTPSGFPGVPSLNRLHSEIDQIHLSIEAQCGTTYLPLGDCHTIQYKKYQADAETLA